jgi:hypothetical protein
MMAELHPVTSLLLARMESHPEEFEAEYPPRWHSILARMLTAAPEEDKAAISVAHSKVLMDRLHRDAMDELLNGDARRAAENNAVLDSARMQPQLQAQMQQYQNAQLRAALGLNTQGMLLNSSPTATYPTATPTPTTLTKLKGVLGI